MFPIILLLTVLHIYDVGAVKSQIDHSLYCEHLAKVTDLCNEAFIHMMCPKTCQMEDRIRKVCGAVVPPVKESTRSRRVVGGSPSSRGSWPWHVALYFNKTQQCAGTVITPEWILTTAGCFEHTKTSIKAKDWIVMAGEHSLLQNEPSESVRFVKKIIIHERNYKYWKLGYRDVPDDYDIALLKLERPLKYTAHISPVCLTGSSDLFTSQDHCQIIGWGSNKRGSRHDVLHEAKVKLIPRDICNLPCSYDGQIHERANCIGYTTAATDFCKYDAGGAVACRKGNRWFSVGMLSWGYNCGKTKKYGVYTNLPLLKSWIIEMLLSYDEASNSNFDIFERISKLNAGKKDNGGEVFTTPSTEEEREMAALHALKAPYKRRN